MKNEDLTAIYNEANGLDPKRHTPITTERIFVAMRKAMAVQRERSAKVCEAGIDTTSNDEWARAHNNACRTRAIAIRMQDAL